MCNFRPVLFAKLSTLYTPTVRHNVYNNKNKILHVITRIGRPTVSVILLPARYQIKRNVIHYRFNVWVLQVNQAVVFELFVRVKTRTHRGCYAI